MKKEKLYICVGENFKEGTRLGFCGDIHTMEDWLEILFPNANAVKYFKGDPAKEIIDYILKNKGKRIELFGVGKR